jgi:hypothetical protein
MNIKNYLLFNPDLQKLNMQIIKKEYYNDLKTNNRVTSVESFFKKFCDFDLNLYKKFYSISEKFTVIETLVHLNINYEKDTLNTIYSINSFLEKYPKCDLIDKNTKLNEDIINKMYEYHLKNNYEKEDCTIDIIQNQDFSKNEINNENQDIIINKKNNILKLAHVFVHLFKIGGGESYLKQFHKYNNINYELNKINYFDETLFISRSYHPNDIDTLFNYDNLKIVYYKSYNELNNYLKDFDIILDHQLYWFDIGITELSFVDIKNIIRITHGAPIHYKNIDIYNYRYSIELYKEYNSDISWNNHIKLYNYIGIENPPFKEKCIKKFILESYNKKTEINGLIIGRICEDKIPVTFINSLFKFVKNNPESPYKFNFYGIIDKTYESFFIREINKINSLNKINTNKKVIYHGYINPDNVSDIYLKNDILIHPSKNEAGATVILEAMAHGLPVICKNRSGMIEALDDPRFLCENDDELFNKLLLINNNYNELSLKNRLKILNKNNQQDNFFKLLCDIKIIYDTDFKLNNIINKTINETINYEKINDNKTINDNETINYTITNIIHYIFGLIPQNEEFSFVYFMSIYSNYMINRPDIIYFHYQYEPYGYWWEKSRKYIKLNYIKCDDMAWGRKKILKYAHKADKVRLDILYKYGGIYMDIDTITIRPYKNIFNDNGIMNNGINYTINDTDCIIGIQEENYLNRGLTLYCNAILISARNSKFIEKWIEMYEKYFVTDGWCEASVHLPQKVINKLDEKTRNKIRILSQDYFYKPSYNEVDKIFEEIYTSSKLEEYNNLLTLHLWNTFSNKYYKEINNNGFYWSFKEKHQSTLYADCIKKVIGEGQKIKDSNIYNLSIIMVYDEDTDEIEKEQLFKNILEQEYIYNMNIEIIVIDNGNKKKTLYNRIFNSSEIKCNLLDKIIDLYIIETNELYTKEICNNIGLEFSKYNTVSYIDFNEEIEQTELIDFFENFNDEDLTYKKSNNFQNYLSYIKAIYNIV